MISGIYADIQKQLLDECEFLKAVRLFNTQFQNEERESVLPTPMALVEFGSTETGNMGQGIQTVEWEITIHLCMVSYEYEDEYILKMVQDVSRALHCFQSTHGMSSPLQRVRVNQDTEHTNLHIWQLEFVAQGTDDVAYYGPKAVDINPTLKITCAQDG